MIPCIIIGRGGSKGFPAKNFTKINGIPIMAYPILAALDAGLVSLNHIYFSTEDKRLKAIAREFDAMVIDRPKELATDGALGEDVFIHAYEWIKGRCCGWNPVKGDFERGEDPIEFIVLMFANAPCITAWMIDEMIEQIRGVSLADSIVTVSKYNMFSPIRMRRIAEVIVYNNMKETKHEIAETDERIVVNLNYDVYGDITKNLYLEPYAPETLEGSNCDRDSSEDAYIYDCSCAVVKPHCLENISEGLPPQRWLGKNILGYKQTDPALDIDFYYQLGQLQWWLDRNWV